MTMPWRKWSDTELLVLEAVAPYYDARLGAVIDHVRKGEPLQVEGHFSGELSEFAAAKVHDAATVLAVREAYLLKAILAELQRLCEIDRNGCQTMLSASKDVVLQRCGRWLASAGDLRAASLEQFAEELQLFSVEYGRQLGILIRSLILLRLVAAEPGGLALVRPEHSLFPGWLVRGRKAESRAAKIRRLDRELAALVLDAVPSEVADALIESAEFFEAGKPDIHDTGRRGGYLLPRDSGFRWCFPVVREPVELPRFEAVLRPAAAGLCEALHYCLRARSAAMAEAGLRGAENLAHRNSRFQITPRIYALLQQLFASLAEFQLVTAWNSASGQRLPGNEFAAELGITACHAPGPGEMYLVREGSRRKVDLNATPPVWGSSLPIAAYTLRRFVVSADELLKA